MIILREGLQDYNANWWNVRLLVGASREKFGIYQMRLLILEGDSYDECRRFINTIKEIYGNSVAQYDLQCTIEELAGKERGTFGTSLGDLLKQSKKII